VKALWTWIKSSLLRIRHSQRYGIESWRQVLLTLILWTTATCWLISKFPDIGEDGTRSDKIFYRILLTGLGYFLLLAAHHIVTFALWALDQEQIRATVPYTIPLTHDVRVAICYTTFNDFIEECAASALVGGDKGWQLFIGDDSTEANLKNRVDAFATRHRDHCTVVRREGRRGFKAGNLNHLLTRIGEDYEYLLLVDNDSLVDARFVEHATALLETNRRLAFVQASHRAYLPADATPFQRTLALGLDTLWRFTTVKNAYGFPMMLGHGALMRTSAVREVDGFPERVSEDLAMTVRLRRRGWLGLISDLVPCGEGIPETFSAYRRRAEKWLIGTLEFLWKDGRAFRSKEVPLVQRLDLGLSILIMLNFAALFAFITTGVVVWPLVSGQWDAEARMAINLPFFSMELGIPRLRLEALTPWQFTPVVRALMIAFLAASFIYFLPDLLRRPVRTVMHVSSSYVCACGILVPSFVTTLISLATRVFEFRGTGDTSESLRWRNGIASNLHVGRTPALWIEMVIGVAGVLLAILTRNLFLGSVSSGVLLAPAFDVFGWNRWLFVPLRHVPFLLFCAHLWLAATATAPAFASGVVFGYF
jgi:cellulose synthase/poly-beta-1,6-N-acetylglucosamine synthase-like glycosyltransferase